MKKQNEEGLKKNIDLATVMDKVDRTQPYFITQAYSLFYYHISII